MSKKKKYVAHIWFLDDDLVMSSQMLTDKCLSKTIDGCIGCIVSTYMYLVGIRSKKFYSYFFSNGNTQQTLTDKFFGWPLKKNPSFSAYQWKESKWCRMCHDNYDYIVKYLAILFDEYSYRHLSMHQAYNILQWAQENEIISSFPYANIEVILPWKSIDPQFRSTNIIDGYRKQYCATQIPDGDVFSAYGNSKRDIPDFVIDTFNLKNVFEK